MKTKIISTLKKELLIIELPEQWIFNIYKDQIGFCNEINKPIEQIKGSYTLLGSPDDLKEEDAKILVERTGLGNPSYSGEWYECYKNPDAMYSKAKDSFNSALEKNIFWVNSEPYPSPYDPRSKTGRFEHGEELEKAERVWKEAESRTFDRTRTLIFVEN